VRELARQAGLPVHDKPDSTGICFIGERPFADFLARFLPGTPGPIETPEGRVLGQHRGLPFYTLGQRSGLTIGGARGCAPEPWYVARKDIERNALIVVQRHEQHWLDADEVVCERINWLCAPRRGTFRADVKLRYRQTAQPARIEITTDGGARIGFDQPQRAATPGQFAVLYEQDRCLGGGVIERARYNSQSLSHHSDSRAASLEDV
jgi:tRNA-specific 2-thiouridylase